MIKEYYIITKSIDGNIKYVQETKIGLRLTENLFESEGFLNKNKAEITLKQWQESWSNHLDLKDAIVRKVTISFE